MQVNKQTGLEELVDDILIYIVGALHPRDVLALRKTSRRFNAITRVHTVWQNVYEKIVYHKGLPLAGYSAMWPSPLTRELEHQVKHALWMEKKWSDSRPSPTRTFQFGGLESTSQLLLIPGGRLLLTTHETGVLCWDLGSRLTTEPPKRTGRFDVSYKNCFILNNAALLPRPRIIIGSVNQGGRPPTVLEIHPELRCSSGMGVFTSAFKIPCVTGRVVLFYGSTIGFLDNVDCSRYNGIKLVSATSPETGSAILVRPDHDFGNYLSSCFHSQFIVVAWQRRVGLYSNPVIPTNGETHHYGLMLSIGLQEPIDHPIAFTACQMPSNKTPVEQTDDGLPPPLTIIARPSARATGVLQFILQIIQEGTKAKFRFIPTPTRADGTCKAICIGPSGRGVRAEATGYIYRCIPTTMLCKHGLIEFTTDFYPNSPIYELRAPVGEDELVIDFDEGMGRVVGFRPFEDLFHHFCHIATLAIDRPISSDLECSRHF